MKVVVPVLALALAGGCLAPVDVGGNDAGHCGSDTCAGCCDSNGKCQAGDSDFACGQRGSACAACPALGVCKAKACLDVGRCALPKRVDFGGVEVGDELIQNLVLTNPTDAAIVATVGAPKNGAPFSVISSLGTVTLPARATVTVPLRFKPTAVGDFTDNLVVRLADTCADQILALTGVGVTQVLTVDPSPLSCGYLQPNVAKLYPLRFSNSGLKPVTVSNVKVIGAEFKLDNTLTTLTVPPLTSATIGVTMKPTMLGPRTGRLDYETDLPRQLAGSVTLQCQGGGPDIDVDPEVVLGSLAYFAGAPTSVNTRFTIRNVGTVPQPVDPKGNLHLGKVPWSVRAKPGVPGNQATADEICVGAFVNGVCLNTPIAGTYDPVQGLEATGTRAILDVPVRITLHSLGWKEWEVAVYSDDPDEPETWVTIRANAIVLPPCSYEVKPNALAFGLVAAGQSRDLELTIKNLGQAGGDACLFSTFLLTAGSDSGFSVVGGPPGSQLLQPGTSQAVTVRFSPKGTPPAVPTPVTGALTFSVSNPTAPTQSIPLTATIGPSCLTVVPSKIDFGAIQKSCNSATRTVLLYNTCPQPLQVQGVTLQGSGAFVAVNTAGVAAGTMIPQGSSPAGFTLKYAPTGEGPDSATVQITVKQGSDVVDVVLPLKGTGDLQGLNYDTLLFGGNTKADILLVIDNSGSMAEKQTSLSAGFPSFIAYANSIGLDYQLGVTTTDMGVEGGRLVGTPKILNSTMTNVNALFAQRVQLGTSGSSTEQVLAPALAAVTAPLVGSDNAGFVRAGATLGIVAVSDAEDQSPQPVAYYVGQLQNVKPPGQVTFSAIAPKQVTSPVGTCSYDGPGPASRTQDAVNALGGIMKEICTPDWNQGLLDLGPSVFGAVFGASSFVLGNVPDLTGGKVITVKVNGGAVPPITPTGAEVWSYDAMANRIVFSPAYAPTPGDAVTATYFVACIP